MNQNPRAKPMLALTPPSESPQHHLYQHLLPCNELHDHRHTQTERVS